MISIFTPTHDSRWLADCYTSLAAQTDSDWEWIIVFTNGARWTPPSDNRIRIFQIDQLRGVGAVKSFACDQAQGDILLELDHDDYLHPGALALLKQTFNQHPNVALVYSDFAEVDEQLKPMPPRFDVNYGWTYHQQVFEIKGEAETYWVTEALNASFPHNASFIWYAPNHLRAFKKDAYEAVGGYDWNLEVLDDQDLMQRLYRIGYFLRIPACLYFQRMHTENTQFHRNAEIQEQTLVQYDKNITANALAWAKRLQLYALDLGAAHGKPDGFQGIDLVEGPGVDFVGDVFEILATYSEGSVGVIRAADFLEHIPDKIRLFNEMYRVLAHGGMLLTLTPSTDGRGAFQDPTHVSFYNENSFWYFTDREYAKFVPEINCQFQVAKIQTGFPTPWHEAYKIAYVEAHLTAIKNGPRMGGLTSWDSGSGAPTRTWS